MTDMDAGARIWMLRTARKHYWRVAAWYDIDDLIQDGFMCYSRVIAKYERGEYRSQSGVVSKGPRRIRSRRHIQSLFQMVYTNHINDLARLRTTNLVEVLAHDIVSEAAITDTVWDELSDDDCDVLVYERLIAEAPSALQCLLRVLITDGPDLKLRAAYRVLRTGRETVNERLCKIAGLDPSKIDVATMLRRYLHNEPLAA